MKENQCNVAKLKLQGDCLKHNPKLTQKALTPPRIFHIFSPLRPPRPLREAWFNLGVAASRERTLIHSRLDRSASLPAGFQTTKEPKTASTFQRFIASGAATASMCRKRE